MIYVILCIEVYVCIYIISYMDILLTCLFTRLLPNRSGQDENAMMMTANLL
jgi:hypothetical protein